MNYTSTRSKYTVSAAEAIVEGIAPDGGLFVPQSMPSINIEDFLTLTYKEMAIKIFELFLTDFTREEIEACVEAAYDHKFKTSNITELKHLEDFSVLELYHGKTLAFKDIALSVLPYLMKTASQKLGIKDEIVILTATSGDTGKAALEGFKDVEGTKIIVFYPSDGISDIQKRQMITQEGENTYVYGIKGNFDDAQTAVKSIFMNKQLKEKILEDGFRFSSANSINIGRLIPQIIYYVNAYVRMVGASKIKVHEPINIVVPSGNFGNILAGNYAKLIGVPIDKLICASNENAVLTEFLKTGIYDINREFRVTNSPSMDILISSNLERFLHLIGEDVKAHMTNLNLQGRYEISSMGKKSLTSYYADFTEEKETLDEIKTAYDAGYLMDTHTAVASHVFKKFNQATLNQNSTIVVSTASPFKFTKHVMQALGHNDENMNEFELLNQLSSISGLDIPHGVKDLDQSNILHGGIIEKDEIQETIEKILRCK